MAAELRLVRMLHRDRNLEGMSGRGLMQRERCQVVQRPARQIIGVEQIHARAAAARRVERRQVLRHRTDREAHPRQVAEELRRLAVEALGDPCGAHQQLLGAGA